MKRVLSVLLLVALLFSVATVTSASADSMVYGDLDDNGKINNRDLGMLQQHLNGYDVTINETLADVDDNGKINNRDLGMLQQYLNGYDITLGPDEPDEPVIPPAELPPVGYDLDGRGRIVVDAISQEGSVVTVTLANLDKKWISEETSYVRYTCTDADGNVLTLEDRYYGTLYFGMLEVGEKDTFTIVLPTGTTKLEFGECRIVYWTQWA